MVKSGNHGSLELFFEVAQRVHIDIFLGTELNNVDTSKHYCWQIMI